MADHFLDTEVRTDIPRTALTCLDAGFTPFEAREIWQREVAPTLGWNYLSIAGEWAGWDQTWLQQEIQKTRQANWLVKATIHRGLARLSKDAWIPIEKTMLHLEELSPTMRELSTRALTELAQIFFDFVPTPVHEMDAQVLETMYQLYPQPFLSIMASAMYEDDQSTGTARVKAAID